MFAFGGKADIALGSLATWLLTQVDVRTQFPKAVSGRMLARITLSQGVWVQNWVQEFNGMPHQCCNSTSIPAGPSVTRTPDFNGIHLALSRSYWATFSPYKYKIITPSRSCVM